MKYNWSNLIIGILILVSFGAIAPLFQAGFFPVHDNTQVARVVVMHKALSDGMFPVRWSDYLGYNYGYPIFNFYGPLAYYVGAGAQFIVHDPLIATKIMMGAAMVLATLSMYYLARAVWGTLGGFVAAVFYLYIPYHALNLYVRGAVGELWAYAFLPLVFYGLYKLYITGRYRYFFVVAVSFAGIILSHNITAFMVIPVLGVIALFLCGIAYSHSQKRTALLLFLGLCVGFLLSSFYTIPALLEMRYANISSILGGGSNPLDHFVCLSQLWQSQWGFGGSGPGCVDGFSLMIGKLHILAVFGGLLVFINFMRQKNLHKTIILAVALVVFVLGVFMMLDASSFIWKSVPAMQYIQFSWRFLSLVALSSSFVAGALVYSLGKKTGTYRLPLQYLIVSCGIILVFVVYGKYFRPQYITLKTDQMSSPSFISWDTSKISDEYMPADFLKPVTFDKVPRSTVTVLSGNVDIIQEIKKTQKIILMLNSKGANLRVNLALFPAWKMYLDGKLVNPTVRQGVYTITVLPGKHTLTAIFTQTPVERIANSLSIIGVFFLITGIIISRRRSFI